ncbi:MAG: hypothetical protein HKM95_16455 [Inquilinus sp.]|nr:hypothetical protein [Inquilinus sp.]
MSARVRGNFAIRLAAVVAVVFGLMTILSGAAVLFGGEALVRAAGRFVPFVVWFNFLAGFAYVGAGLGLWFRRRWAAWLAYGIAAATLAAFAALGVHIVGGGGYEARTVAAMALRSTVWVAVSLVAYRFVRRPRSG